MSEERSLAIKKSNAEKKVENLQRKGKSIVSQVGSVPEKVLQEKRIRLYWQKAKAQKFLQQVSEMMA